MEYQKAINFLNNTPINFLNLEEKNWVVINDDSREMHNTKSQIKFKISMLKSSLFYYSNAYMLVKDLYQLETLQLQVQQQVIMTKM